LIRSARRLAIVALTAVVTVSCARIGTGSTTNVHPADIYAGALSASDVRTLLGDSNWWAGPPSFEVRPLDAATTSFTERYSVSQVFLHLGSAEALAIRYTVYDKSSSATTAMTAYQNAYGASPTSPKVGDAVLYYGLGGSGGAPYITRTLVRVGQVVVVIGWSRKDGMPSVQQLGRNATKVVDGLKKVMAGKVHASPRPVDLQQLPPPGLDVTLLGATQLPIEAWVVMANIAIPEAVLQTLQGAGVNDFVYGDYALNDDTHMEVRTALLTFTSTAGAADWANTFAPGTPDQAGIASGYVRTGGASAAAGEYHYFFIAGTHGGMLVCRPTIEGEAASRACEAPVERTAVAWKIALGG
jgi:hypothetical protein